jgi:Raf kinase inhibitor-like YbhB/YbcL family protein
MLAMGVVMGGIAVRIIGAGLAVIVSLGLAGPTLAFELSSPSLVDGKWPAKFLATACGGQNLSPALAWTDVPAGTRSFVLTLFDRDALDGFGWWHWQVLRLPATATGLAEGAGAPGGKGLPKGAVHAPGDLGRPGYLGPCVAAGAAAHRFVFTLYALKTAKPETEAGASPGMIVADTMRGALGTATVTYPYSR